MKIKSFILILLFSLVNCKKQEFDELDFSYGNTFETDFSIKFSADSDSVFIREHWSPNDFKKPVSKTNYASKLSKLQKKELDSFVKNTDFSSFEPLYFEDYSDGEYFSFVIKKDGGAKKINVHSYKAPKSLTKFAEWIYKTKKSLKLMETSRQFEFMSKDAEVEPPKAS